MTQTLIAPDETVFSEFVAASEVSVAEKESDALTNIEGFLAVAVAEVGRIGNALGRVRAAGVRMFGEERGVENMFERTCRPDSMRDEISHVVVELFKRDYVQPLGVEIDNYRNFLSEALIDERNTDEGYDPILDSWDSSKVRAAFRRQFGDVREASIAQLRERVLQCLGSDCAPGDVTTMWCRAHRKSHRSGMMELTYERHNVERLFDLLTYIVHLATGAVPTDITIPELLGVSRSSQEWERKDLLKRQTKPLPGVKWLRFTADGEIEVALEPQVLSQLKTQWTNFWESK